MAKKAQRPLKIFVLSGGTGRTAESILNSALAQFRGPQPELIPYYQLRSAKAAASIVQRAAEENAVLVHSVVEPKVREALVEAARRTPVPMVDILGPALAVLADYLEMPPQGAPGQAHELQKERFDRIDAVDFTLAHDDGALVHELDQADVVLVGVSRVSKSVTCFYLAYRGIRAANVPFVGRCEPPEPLLEIDPRRVVGLTMNARRLTSLRETRSELLGGGSHEWYVDSREIARELTHANGLIEKHGWHRIDVSYKSVEEVAQEIVQLVRC